MNRDVTDEQINGIHGAFWVADWELFRMFLDETERQVPGGDLLEVGVAWGRSAVVIGGGLRDDETLTVIDLFGDQAPSLENAQENTESYPGLTEEVFAANYRGVHGELPEIIRGPSTVMTERLPHSAFRFVHVDAGHLFEQVRSDLLDTRTLLAPQGVIVADDWRTIHAPGVGAAIWDLVDNHGLKPICVSSMKFYGTWGDPSPYLRALDGWLADRDPADFVVRRDTVHGNEITTLTDGPALVDRGRLSTPRWLWAELVRRVRRG